MSRISPFQLYILVHLKRANIDYAISISKTLKIPLKMVETELERMKEIGYLERNQGSAIKRTQARFKLSYEVRKHHTYYELSKKGELTLREILKDVKKYFEGYTGFENSYEIYTFIIKAEYEHLGHIAKTFSMNTDQVLEILDTLCRAGLIEKSKPKILKRKHRKGKPKKETRTQHKYYKVTRMGEMLYRYYR